MVFYSLVYVLLVDMKGVNEIQMLNFKPKYFYLLCPFLTPNFRLLSIRGMYVIATPYASGFDHFLIADEVQFKFDRCLRFLKEPVSLLN